MTTANLALQDLDPVIQYVSTGETTFAFPFPVLASAELKVSVDQVPKVLGTDYSINGIGQAAGGEVVFVAAVPAGQRVTLWLDVPLDRLTGFSAGVSTLLPQDLNTEFVRRVRVDQVLRRDIGRALRLAIDDPQHGQDMIVPTRAVRADRLLGFDDAGRPIAVDQNARLEAEPRPIPTINAMKGVASPQDGDAVVVAEDARGGLFVFDVTATGAADNGITFKADDATVGSWVRRFGGAALAEWWGVVGGAVAGSQRTTNTNALRSWLSYVVGNNTTGSFGSRRIETDGSITISDPGNAGKRFAIIGRTTIAYAGAAPINHVLDLRFDDLSEAFVAGVRVDGNSLAHAGIALVANSGAAESLVVRDCQAHNLRISDDAGVTVNGHGIRVAANNAIIGRYAEISGCLVTNLTKAVRSPTLAQQGIIATNFDLFKIEHNVVDTVRHDGATLIDADGIVVFSGNDAGVYRRSSGTISNNICRNCEGRGIKLQTNGEVRADNNTIIVDGAIELHSGWCGLDSQTGDCRVSNLSVFMGSSWTGGSTASAVLMQVPANPLTNMVDLRCDGLKLQTGKTLSRILDILPVACTARVNLTVENVVARGPGVVTSTTTGDHAATIFAVVTLQAGLSSSDRYRVITRNLDIHTVNHYVLAVGSSGLSDVTDILALESYDDLSWPLSVVKGFWSTSSSTQTSSLTIRGLRCGSDSRVAGDLNFAKFGIGSHFYVGPGTHSNAPANNTFNAIVRGPQDFHVHRGTIHYHTTSDGSGTWRSVTYA